MLYARYLREIPTATVPRQWVQTLLDKLEALLNAHAELAVRAEPYIEDEEPPPGGADEVDDGSWPPEEIEPDEAYNEGTIH